MNRLAALWNQLSHGIGQVIFPDICVCCGQETLHRGHHICPFCLDKRFEYPEPVNSVRTSNAIVPDAVQMQFALWTFDKGGILQNLMHQLKYERLTGIGHQMGETLARRVEGHEIVQEALQEQEALLVPVPLHYLKFRRRGFNQAFSIARGIQNVLKIPICSINAVRRTKNTRSQTGFSLQKRIENMDDAFKVARPNQFKDKLLIIIDDVFTTGATSFELAQTLAQTGAAGIFIWTVAQA